MLVGCATPNIFCAEGCHVGHQLQWSDMFQTNLQRHASRSDIFVHGPTDAWEPSQTCGQGTFGIVMRALLPAVASEAAYGLVGNDLAAGTAIELAKTTAGTQKRIPRLSPACQAAWDESAAHNATERVASAMRSHLDANQTQRVTGAAHSHGVIVASAPGYAPNDSFALEIDLPSVGVVAVRLESQGDVGMHGAQWTLFNAIVVVDRAIFFEGEILKQTTGWNWLLKRGTSLHRHQSTISFPLRQGAEFENLVLEMGPCPNDATQTCMNVIYKEACRGTVSTSRGIEFDCDGSAGRIHYVMDHQFRWLVTLSLT